MEGKAKKQSVRKYHTTCLVNLHNVYSEIPTDSLFNIIAFKYTQNSYKIGDILKEKAEGIWNKNPIKKIVSSHLFSKIKKNKDKNH